MKWKVFDYLAIGFTLSLAINLVIIFFVASLNGGKVLVLSNQFGEQSIELVLFPIWIVMGLITLIRFGLKLRRLDEYSRTH